MEPASLQELINVIGRKQANAGGEVQLNISSDEKNVRLDFGKALAWFIIPKAHALQLGVLLMQHGGAQVQRIGAPEGGQPPPDTIDVKPS